jgi:ABC-2 type transport system permease protein
VRRWGAIALKEARLIVRDPVLITLQIVFPALCLLVFGSLFSITLRELPIAVLDRDHSDRSREVLRELGATDYFASSATGRPDVELDAGRSLATLDIPPGFGRARSRGHGAGLQLLVDGSDGAARAAEGYLDRFARAAEGAVDAEPPSRIGVATWYNPERRDANFFVPGVVTLLLFSGPVIFTGLSLVREKLHGTWDMLRAAPVADWELLVGKLLPYLVHAAVLAIALFGVARWVFALPMRGPLVVLLAASLLFLICGVSLGAVFAMIADDEDELWRYISIFVLLPGFVLSGFIYPVSSMPEVAQWLSRLFPVRAYLELVRGVALKGAGAALLTTQLRLIAFFTAGALGLAVAMIERARRPT